MTSCDVIFEEGVGHHSLTILTELDEDGSNMPVVGNMDSQQDVLTIWQPVAPKIRAQGGPLYMSDICHVPDMPEPIPDVWVLTQALPPP